jgi:hypothetical protein
MADIRLLERTLAETLTWSTARINFLSKFALASTSCRSSRVAALQVTTVSLVQISGVRLGRAKPASHDARWRRLWRSCGLPLVEIARLVSRWLGLPCPVVIAIARTDFPKHPQPI